MNEGATRTMIGLIAVAAGAAASVGLMSTSPPVTTMDRTAIEKIVHDYIMANPEILPQAMERLHERDNAKAVAANRAAIETPFAGAWEGAANADVTVVQFFDYNCGYCRAALPNIDRLLAEDKKLRVVYREFPVLGAASENAARVSLVAARSGKYPQFHRALYASGALDTRKIGEAAKQFGIDAAIATTSDLQKEIDANLALARPLGLTGTPSWVIGDRVLTGNVGYDELKEAVAAARAR